MNYIPFLLVVACIAIVYFGTEILARLPRSNRHGSFETNICTDRVYFKIEAVVEKDFEVGYVDGWSVGRSFSLYGSVMPTERSAENDLDFGARTGVHVFPSPDWFQKSQIGRVRTFPKGGCESNITLPYQIARHLLEDLRENTNQVASVGFNHETGQDGKPAYTIYSFELSEPPI